MNGKVHYKGKLEKVELDNSVGNLNNIEEKCKYLMNSLGDMDLSDYDSWREYLEEKYYEQYVIYKKDIYKVVNKRDAYEWDIFEISNNSDGSYDFDIMYYSGNYNFNGAIEEAFSRRERYE